MAAALVAAAGGCAEPRDPYTLRGAQVESRTEGDLALFWGWCDADTIAVVAPYHAADARDRWLQESVTQATGDAVARRCLALSLFRFGDAGAFVLAMPDSPITLQRGPGRCISLAPSEVLATVTGPADAKLLASALGANGVPKLSAGQSLRLLVVVPSGWELADCTAVELGGAGGVVTLAPATVGAVAWDEFRSQPGRTRFEQLVGGARGPTRASRVEGSNDGQTDGFDGR